MSIRTHVGVTIAATIFLAAVSLSAGMRVQVGREVVTGSVHLSHVSSEPTLSLNHRGYVGVIAGDEDPNEFILYDSSGRQLFTVSSQPDARFYNVNMTTDSGLILTAHIDEGVYQCVGYDYAGKKIFGPVTADSPLRPSTGWRFLYTGNNVIFGSTPKIFDTDGTLLTEFHVRRGDLWQMYPLADTAVLLQDSNAVRVISVVPTMIVLKEYWLPDLGRYDHFETSVSPDGTAYAVSGDDRIVILDLATGAIADVPMEFRESILSTPHFCLSPGGSSLLLQDYSGNVVSIYRLIGGKYAQTAGSPDAARPSGGGFEYGLPCFIGNYCLLNYFVTTPDGVLHSSVVFDYVTANGERYPALSIPGIASAAAANSVDQVIVFNSVGPVSAGANATISRVQLQGVSDEK